MKAPRDVFGETLVELNEAYPQLMVLCSDLGAATKTGVFEKKFPEKSLFMLKIIHDKNVSLLS